MNIRTLELTKLGHRFIIRYEVGTEQAVLDELAVMVQRAELPFDWYDAAVMSHQLGKHLNDEMNSLSPKTNVFGGGA